MNILNIGTNMIKLNILIFKRLSRLYVFLQHFQLWNGIKYLLKNKKEVDAIQKITDDLNVLKWIDK